MKAEAVVFDLFGTLLDITSLAALAAPIVGAGDADAFVLRWRDKQISYSFAATLMQRYQDFDEITMHALDYALASLGLTTDRAGREALANGWLQLLPYPDAVSALEALRSRGIRTAVLTNGTAAMAKRALSNSGLDAYLGAVWSVDEVRAYKPSPAVYAIATARLMLEPRAIAFVSSNGWDATGAAAFGLRVIWCNRRELPRETLEPPPAHTIATLDELAALV